MAIDGRRFRRAQQAARRLFLNARGELNPDGVVLAARMRRLCGVGKAKRVVYGPDGNSTMLATTIAAAKAEIWDSLVTLLHLDPRELTNLDEDEYT